MSTGPSIMVQKPSYAPVILHVEDLRALSIAITCRKGSVAFELTCTDHMQSAPGWQGERVIIASDEPDTRWVGDTPW